MATAVSDEENPLLRKKPKKDPLDFSDIPSSVPAGDCLVKVNPVSLVKRAWEFLHPVVRVKDLNSASGDDIDCPKKSAIEIGIGGTF